MAKSRNCVEMLSPEVYFYNVPLGKNYSSGRESNNVLLKAAVSTV